MFIALACLPLAASLFFLKRDENYSIYPKKWIRSINVGEIIPRKNSQNIPSVPSVAIGTSAGAAAAAPGSDDSSLNTNPIHI